MIDARVSATVDGLRWPQLEHGWGRVMCDISGTAWRWVMRFGYPNQQVNSTGRLVLPPLCAESGSTPPLPPTPSTPSSEERQ